MAEQIITDKEADISAARGPKTDRREVLDAAMEAGHILLENGAEIFRVEETIHRISKAFGVESLDTFVLTNGIFMTAGNENEKKFSRVHYIPVKGAQLHRVAAVNQLSREIEEGKYTIEEVKQKLEEIALGSEKIREFTEGKEIFKVITVPGKLVNLVVK